MAVTPLTPAQRGAVTALVSGKRLQQVPADEGRAESFLGNAADSLADLRNVTRAQNQYNLAYDAAHDAGEAMLAAYGYRTSPELGQHEALGRFLVAIFDAPPENAAGQHYDTMRRERNQMRYRGQSPTVAAATVAENSATVLFAAARARVTLSR